MSWGVDAFEPAVAVPRLLERIGERLGTAGHEASEALSEHTSAAAVGLRRSVGDKVGIEAAAGSSPHVPELRDTAPQVGNHTAATDLATLIEQRSAQLGLDTPARRALEAGLFIDRPLLEFGVVSGHPNPELLFGQAEWAGYLDARAFAREYGEGELNPDFIAELHRRAAGFAKPEIAGKFRSGSMIGVLPEELGDAEIAAIEANPLLRYVPGGTDQFPRGGIEYGAHATGSVEEELRSLSKWYNDQRAGPGYDPYRLAAELEQRLVAVHPFPDYNGRVSRLLMNWSLERDGLSPGLLEHYHDLTSTPTDWADVVRRGSATYDTIANRIARGADVDPVAAFRLEGAVERYRMIERILPPLVSGGQQRIGAYRSIMATLRGW
ncbi:Fic family protein [Nocardia stercoris]|uniref:Fic family protein n=1 Tax=Nocardia stercoris TaxID=2483361 RepID=A0A3M2L2I0_9NOCA|nr:Fic family protein [Nocardia stercoris]RMI30930.1 Fic family protein [Nocardia stercoris]